MTWICNPIVKTFYFQTATSARTWERDRATQGLHKRRTLCPRPPLSMDQGDSGRWFCGSWDGRSVFTEIPLTQVEDPHHCTGWAMVETKPLWIDRITRSRTGMGYICGEHLQKEHLCCGTCETTQNGDPALCPWVPFLFRASFWQAGHLKRYS